jgi:signal transduction histidine kinase
MPPAGTQCAGLDECLRRYGPSTVWPCGIPCHCEIQQAGHRLCRRIVLYSALVIVTIAAIVALVALELRQSALDTGRANAANLSAAFEEQVRRVLDSLSGAMERTERRIEADGAAFDLSQWTLLAPGLTGQPIAVAVTGPEGIIRAGSLWKSRRTDISGEDYFLAQRNSAKAGLFIGKPELDPKSKQPAIQFTRRLEKPGGGFAGVLVFSLDPDFLTPLHRTLDLGGTGVMTLAGTDKFIRASHAGAPAAPVPPGTSLAGEHAVEDAARAVRGAYIAKGVLDGVERIVDWRKVPGYPLLVIVGLGKDEFLANPARLALIILGLGGAAMLLSGAMAAMAVREISNRVRYEIEVNARAAGLRAANENLTIQQVALVKTASELARERVNLKELNSKLMLAQQQSDAASRAKSAFLANMSHELRTPLNAIIGFSEIIRDRLFGPAAPAYFEYAGDINNAGHHLLAIVNDVLDIAKIEAGKVEFSEGEADLGSILNASLRAVKTQAKSGNVRILKEYPREGIKIRCDEVRLRQVFINVLSNAVKFTPAGGEIEIGAALEDSGGLCIAVRDTGIGMTAAEIDAAFEKFRQIGNSLTKRFEGTGLGLPLAKQLAELHGGAVEVSSEPGVGTEVRIRLPAFRVASADLPAILKQRAALPGPIYAGNAAAGPAQPAAAA